VGVKYWEINADNPSKAGWSWGCVSAVDSHGRTMFVADAHRGDGQRFIVRADEKLTVFIELELGDSRLRRIANLHRKRFSIISKAAQAKTSSI
jgi:hypothetical protein